MIENLWVITYLDKPTETAQSEIVVYGGSQHQQLGEAAKNGQIRIDGEQKIDVPRCPKCGYHISGGYNQNMPDLSKHWPIRLLCSHKNEAHANCIMCGWESNDFNEVKRLLDS